MSNIVEGVDLEARFRLMATIIQDHLRYKQGMNSNLFQRVIHDEWVCVGKSKSGGGYKEHVVPCVYLAEESKKMFVDGRTVEDVARFLEKNFKIVEITIEEAGRLDSKKSGLKQKMPPDWDRTDEFARLRACEIEWEPVREQELNIPHRPLTPPHVNMRDEVAMVRASKEASIKRQVEELAASLNNDKTAVIFAIDGYWPGSDDSRASQH